MLVWFPLGILISYAIIDTDDRLTKVIRESKTFQKQLVKYSLINLLLIAFITPYITIFIIPAVGLYLMSEAKDRYRELTKP